MHIVRRVALPVMLVVGVAMSSTYRVGSGRPYQSIPQISVLLNPGDTVLVDGKLSFVIGAEGAPFGGHPSTVSLKIYDVLGREVAKLVDEMKPAGRYSAVWNAGSLPGGVYFCRLRAGNSFTQVRKMVLMK
jgi:hypothetical protein